MKELKKQGDSIPQPTGMRGLRDRAVLAQRSLNLVTNLQRKRQQAHKKKKQTEERVKELQEDLEGERTPACTATSPFSHEEREAIAMMPRPDGESTGVPLHLRSHRLL